MAWPWPTPILWNGVTARGIIVKGAGFLLNNEMIDFNWYPGVTTRDGTIGTEANQIAPGKRMLSSQTPTIVAKDGKVVLITGSPGSRTIINTVLCMVVNVIDFDMSIRDAVDAPRLHHQWFPDMRASKARANTPSSGQVAGDGPRRERVATRRRPFDLRRPEDGQVSRRGRPPHQRQSRWLLSTWSPLDAHEGSHYPSMMLRALSSAG